MTIFSYLRRRILGKAAPLVKRVLLPTVIFMFVLHALTSHRDSEPHDLSNLVVPGEAIDPILKKTINAIYESHMKDHPEDLQKLPTLIPQPSPVVREKPAAADAAGAPEPAGESPSSKSSSNSNSKGDLGKEKERPSAQNSHKSESSSWSMAKANITGSHKVKFKGHAITSQTVTLTLMSSSDKVFMSLNKKEIYRNLQDRGLHMVVLNQHTGKVMTRRVFDTFSVGVEEEMVDFIDDIQDGRIIVFAVLDEASKGMTWRARNKLKELGSRYADKLNYRDMWALVTRKGGFKLAETYSNVATADTGYEWGGPVFLRTDFDLEEKSTECKWPHTERNDARRVFCQSYEGYGALCDCSVTNWNDIFFQSDVQLHHQLAQTKLYKDLGVVIIGTNRPHYLFRTLKALWEAPGLNRDLMAVYIDDHHQEMTAVAKLFGVHLVVSPALGNSSAQHIRHKLQRVFRDVMGARFAANTIPEGGLPEDTIPPFSCGHVLLLEDDLQVSVDVFKYLHTAAPLFERDPTVLAISCFNYYGYRDVANSLTTFYRTAEVNHLALLLPSRTLNDHLAPNWLEAESASEWYKALALAMGARRGNAIVYPEIPRAKHIAFQGEVVNSGVQYNLFRDHTLALTTDYDIPETEILKMELSQYEVRLLETLKASDPIRFDFCKHDLIYDTNPVVMYVPYNGSKTDEQDWHYVMDCMRTWSLYTEAGWKGVWQFHYHGHWLSIVTVPFSEYSYLKPENYEMMTAPPTTSTTATTPSSSSSSSPSKASDASPAT